jgi:hypothetical protein
MSADRFEYPDLALTVERGKVGQPSRHVDIVTLDWIANMADGTDVDCKLVLGCALALNRSAECRELTVLTVGGDNAAVTEFGLWATRHRSLTEIEDTKTWLEDERMEDVALALGRVMVMPDLHLEYPRLLVKVIQ